MAFAETANLAVKLTLGGNFTSQMGKAQTSLNRFDQSVKRVGSGAGKLSTGFARAGTVVAGAVVTGLAGAAKAAIDFEDAFAGVKKTVDETELNKAGKSFRDIELALRNMATEMPNSAIELANIAEAAGAMGIAGKDIEAFTKQVAILSSTTNVSSEDAATALGQLANVIGLTGDEFDNFAASLVDLGNKGASTEASILEIAKRSGGAAKLFGIAKKETLGWAAAAANLGLNEELAGTALQNVFVKLLPKVSSGSKTLQGIMGKTAKQIKKAFKEDASGALESFIAQLGKMEKDDRLAAIQDIFGKGSGITRLVNGLADSYANNLAPSLDTATESWEEATAAQIEFDKKNATVKSSILRLRNGIYEAGITIGEGFVPALGRAASKLSEFLKQGENRNALKALGEDIGKSIDAIDWNAVLRGAREFLGVMKVAFDWAKRLYDLFSALPTEVKGAVAGLLVLNKASGGLIGGGIGDIAGGIAGAAIAGAGSKVPGVGRLFAQPVFVTNGPLGGLGGGGVAAGVKGGLGTLAKVALVGEAIGLTAAVYSVQQEVSAESTAHATAIQNQTAQWLAQNPSKADLLQGLGGVQAGIDSIRSNPLNVLVQGEALTKLEGMKSAITNQLETSIEKTKASVDLKGDAQKAAIAAAANRSTTDAERIKGSVSLGTAATQSGTAAIVSAIHSIDLTVQNTTISKTTTIQKRYGPVGGSRNDSRGDGFFGNGGFGG
jgi:TP901 family phage tail tape measure protein